MQRETCRRARSASAIASTRVRSSPGVIPLIAAEREVNGQRAVFCNVASWYVLEEFRAYAQLIVSIALRNKDFTYTNVSPAPHTWSIVENQGYTRYCNGLFFAAAALAKPLPGIAVEAFDPSRNRDVPDFALLSRHASMGCTVVVARDGAQCNGFVFSAATASAADGCRSPPCSRCMRHRMSGWQRWPETSAAISC